jgi:hypothetical protein
MITNKRRIITGLAGVALLAATSAHSVTIGTFDNTTVKLGGYVKLDALFSDFSEGPVGTGIGRDFYVPSITPVKSAATSSENTYFDMHARQTRVHLGTDSKVGDHKLKSYIEIDFMVLSPSGADERISNSYSPRMRHAFIEFDKWLFGQTWSTFQNTASLPDSVDFIGNTDAGIFIRQPQVRYTRGPWQFSIENPETTVTTAGGRVVADDNEWPDFVGRYNLKTNNLSLAAAVLLRQLTYNTTGTGGAIDDSESAYGISITGKYMLGKDDIRFGVNTGSGMGRYIGLNVANGAIVDANNKLEAIDSTGLFASYRHLWNAKWRSNFMYSRIDIDNNINLTGTGATKSTYSARINLFYSATDKLTFGGEYAHANRELESGADGNLDRLQFTAKLDF